MNKYKPVEIRCDGCFARGFQWTDPDDDSFQCDFKQMDDMLLCEDCLNAEPVLEEKMK